MLDAVLEEMRAQGVAFTEPVTVEDMGAFRDLLRQRLLGAHSIEVSRNVPGPVLLRVDHVERNVSVVENPHQ